MFTKTGKAELKTLAFTLVVTAVIALAILGFCAFVALAMQAWIHFLGF